jgi:hypothetical protein
VEPLAATRLVARAAAPARLLFLGGRRDPHVRPRLAEALWRAAPAARRRALWYSSGHGMPAAAGDDVGLWLAEQLGVAPPPVFRGRAEEFVGTYGGWGGHMDPLELRVTADALGRLALPGPFTHPDDPAGRLRYLGPSAEGEAFRLDDKRLTFVRAGGRVTSLVIDAPIDAPPEVPRAHLVLARVRPPGAARPAAAGGGRP